MSKADLINLIEQGRLRSQGHRLLRHPIQHPLRCLRVANVRFPVITFNEPPLTPPIAVTSLQAGMLKQHRHL